MVPSPPLLMATRCVLAFVEDVLRDHAAFSSHPVVTLRPTYPDALVDVSVAEARSQLNGGGQCTVFVFVDSDAQASGARVVLDRVKLAFADVADFRESRGAVPREIGLAPAALPQFLP